MLGYRSFVTVVDPRASCAEPTCSIRRAAPRRTEYTICTAVAPDAVLTVRTYATTPEATRSP